MTYILAAFRRLQGINNTRFPRTWIKGTQEELAIREAEKADRDRFMLERGYAAGQTQGVNGEGVEMPQQPPKTFTYTPQAYTSY